MTVSTGVGRGGARQGAGRQRGSRNFWTPEQIDRFRSRIQTDKILKRLNQVASGEIVDANSPSITAGLGLLKKVVPDLASFEITGKDGESIKHEVALTWMTEAEAKSRGWA